MATSLLTRSVVASGNTAIATPEIDMSRYAITRSLATMFMALGLAILIALLAAVPFAGLNPMTVAFAGMIVAGVGMLLRERVLVRAEPAPAFTEDRRRPHESYG